MLRTTPPTPPGTASADRAGAAGRGGRSRLTLRRLALIAAATAGLGLSALGLAVAAGWLTLTTAALATLAAAMLGGLGLVALGVRRVLLLLQAGFRHTRAQLDQGGAVLAGAAGHLGQATTQVETALHDLRAAAAADRLEVLHELARVSEQAGQVAQQVRAAYGAQAKQARQATAAWQDVRTTSEDHARQEAALRRTLVAGAAAAARARARLPDQLYAKVEANLALRALVQARAPLPSLGGWALDADVLYAVAVLMWRRRPELVVECGSGASSVWLGYLLERLGQGRVVALEHDPHFLAASQELVAAHGLSDRVEIRYAPLSPWSPQGDPSEVWYDLTAIDDLKQIGLLLVDGPPEAVGARARYPAGPLLIPRCTDDAVVVLDDTHRDGEQQVSRAWQEERPELRRADTNRPLPADIFLRTPAGAGRPGGEHDR